MVKLSARRVLALATGLFVGWAVQLEVRERARGRKLMLDAYKYKDADEDD